MATLAVGDVHGQLDDLRSLLSRAKPSPGDRVVFVGDLVGRGPDSVGVLREVASMGDAAEAVLGNHDLHLLRARVPGAAPRRDTDGILDHPEGEGLCDWLLRRPLAVAVPEADAVVVHAGAWPSWDLDALLGLSAEAQRAFSGADRDRALVGMYGSDEDRWDCGLEGGRRLQAIVNVMTRMRAVTAGGAIDWSYRGMPGEPLPDGSVPWFDAPGRALGATAVVCGHWSTLGLYVRRDVAMIDTGCCFGQPLAGLWIEDRKLVFSR